jgi:hypothetical protein
VDRFRGIFKGLLGVGNQDGYSVDSKALRHVVPQNDGTIILSQLGGKVDATFVPRENDPEHLPMPVSNAHFVFPIGPSMCIMTICGSVASGPLHSSKQRGSPKKTRDRSVRIDTNLSSRFHDRGEGPPSTRFPGTDGVAFVSEPMREGGLQPAPPQSPDKFGRAFFVIHI